LDLTRPAVSHAFVSSRHVLASATLQLNELIRQKVREQGQTLQVAMEVPPYLLAIPGIVAGSGYCGQTVLARPLQQRRCTSMVSHPGAKQRRRRVECQPGEKPPAAPRMNVNSVNQLVPTHPA
jgi:hypothetical protein